MTYNFDEVINRMGTNSVKWEMINGGKNNDLLPLWVADMDFPCAQPIIRAMHERIDEKIFGYSFPNTETYLSSVQNWFKKRFDWEISKEEMVVSPGVVPALGFLIKCLTKDGEGVIIQRPVYYPFTNLIQHNNRKVVNNALINKNGVYNVDFEDLEKKAKDPNNKLFILCSPHNPMGRVWTKEELIKMADICLKNDVMIISDEIHCDLVRKNVKHLPLAKLVDDEKIITCTAPSKTFNLAGLQMSNIFIKSEKIRKMWEHEVLNKSGIFGSNAISINAVIAAYNEGEEWLSQVLEYIDDNFEFTKDYVESHFPKAKFTIPKGTYFAWIDFREYGYSHETLESLMIDKAKVALDEGYIFGDEGRGFERINVACPRSILEDCLNRMKKAIID